MSDEPTVAAPTAEESYVPLAEDDWEQDRDELPPRPRRRLLGVGANPLPIALLGVLLLACGFIGGVLVEKGQTSSTTSTGGSGLASRFAALRGGAGGASTGATSSGGVGAAASGGGFARRAGAGAGAPGGATIGEVAYLAGSTLYVSDAEGNTVKITTSPASSITKTVKSDVHAIQPGDTVIVRGAKSSSGALRAESISIAAAGSDIGGGGLGALFGGGGSASRSGSATGGTSGGGASALFGR